MAVQFDGGVVIGADSRTTTGSYIVRGFSLSLYLLHSDSMALLGKSRHRQTHPYPRSDILLSVRLSGRHAGCRRYCSLRSADAHVCPSFASCTQPLTLRWSSQTIGEQPTVETAANLFQKMCYDNKDGLSAGIIVAGWDKRVGPSVYNIPLGGGLFRQPWAIGGMYTLCQNVPLLNLNT